MKRILSAAIAISAVLSATACSARRETSAGSGSGIDSVSSAGENPAATSSSKISVGGSESSPTSVREPQSTGAESSAVTPPESSLNTSSSSESTSTSSSANSTTTSSSSAVSTSAVSQSSSTASDVTEPVSRPVLSNPNASPEAVRLYEYLCSVYGNAIISGQQESTWMGSEQYEFDHIYSNTGKYPAIRGLDYMNDDFSGVNRRAKEWHDRGGIVTICWHCGSDFSGSWSESMNTAISDWSKALTEGTPEYEKLIAGMDKGAKALRELKEQNIAVLWRPFHELDGAWFWWGKGGSENFKKLWQIMYRRYTDYWQLDNLIWVLGYSGNGNGYGKWYPGDEYVDIAGADSYNDGANQHLFVKVRQVVGNEMPICFHECGRIPTVKQLKSSKAGWVWFMTWHTDYITNGNSISDLKNVYNDEYVITLDELPAL